MFEQIISLTETSCSLGLTSGFSIFSLEIRWYSLSYIFGLVFGWYYAKNKLLKDSIQKEYFDDYITYLIIIYISIRAKPRKR